MTAVIIGSIGFLCCFLYDHNSIRLKKSFLHPFFSIGCFLIAVSTGLVIRSCWPRRGSSFFISAVFLTAAILFLGLLTYTCFLRCPLMRHMSKKIMKGWPIQRVFMHSADILAFCGSPDFIFAWPDFWDPGRQWGLLGSLLCGIYCTFFTRTGSCFRKHSVITERISRQLPF